MIHVGFTGTQHGMTSPQLRTLAELLIACKFHHGDCLGADAQAHGIARQLGCQLYIHPCTLREKRAFCTPAFVVYPPRAPLKRNEDIVDTTSWLIAAPGQDVEVMRSGTWATIRFARRYRETFDGSYRITQILRDGTLCEL